MIIVTKDNINEIRKESGLNTFILKRKVKTNGEFKDYYHEKLEYKDDKQSMNVYVEHLTSVRKNAVRFYDVDEAMSMGTFLQKDKFYESVVIKTNRK